MNTYVLGQTFTAVQVISPLFSLFGFMTNVVLSPYFTAKTESWNNGKKPMQAINIACLILLMLPLLLVAFIFMSYGGNEAHFCQDGPLFD